MCKASYVACMVNLRMSLGLTATQATNHSSNTRATAINITHDNITITHRGIS